MDTPARGRDAMISSASASASHFEESPVFHYINNLSPLELVKSSGSGRSFNWLSSASASPLAAFTPPHTDTHKGHLKLRSGRHLPSGSLIHDFSETENKDRSPVGVQKSVEELDTVDGKSGLQALSASGNHDIMPIDHDTVNPVATHSTTMPEHKDASRTVSCDPFIKDMDAREMNLNKICQPEQYLWDLLTVVPDAGLDVINFNSSTFLRDIGTDPGTVVSSADIIHNPENTAYEELMSESADLMNSIVESNREQVLALSSLSHVSVHELAANPNAELDEFFVASSDKQSTLLRRCLFSEMATTDNSSVRKSLSVSDIDDGVKWDSGTSDMPLALTSSCDILSASQNLMSVDISPKSYLDVEKMFSSESDLVQRDDEAPKTEGDCRTLALVSKELEQCSPLKGSELDHDVEILSCKRCNCRKSKCLKLYCDCFAAGLYCIEPCSCQDCFNRPAFKDKVLETRAHIEFRNPLAFAPRVVTDADSYFEGEEEGTKTPASATARHKQGCRCKKSSCQKKYCECFQAGVGCSSNCRCEGCKNAYGHKDDILSLNQTESQELERRDIEAHRKVRSDIISKIGESGEGRHGDIKRPTDDRVRIKMPTTLKSHIGASPLNDGAPRNCSTRKRDALCTISNKHKFRKQDETTADAENRDINQGTQSDNHSSPGTLKRHFPTEKGVSQLTPWRQYVSSTAMRSSRRRVILKSITSLESTDA